MENSFCYQLDLVIRLVDTTVGRPVTERNVLFVRNGRRLSFLYRGEGIYVLLNGGREDKSLTVIVKGYLETTVDIRYGELAVRCPEVYVELIPKRPKYGSCDLMDISGNKPGISSVAAVCLSDPSARALSYNAEKRQIKLLESGRLDEKAYALIHAQTENFEEFHVASAKNKLFLRLARPLQTELQPKEEIARIVRGRTEGNGNYLLRLRGDREGKQYLVRYVVKGRTEFKKITAGKADDGGREN